MPYSVLYPIFAMLRRCTALAAVLSFVVALGGCAGTRGASAIAQTLGQALGQTLGQAASFGDRLAGVALNPSFRYLRIGISGGGGALLVLGYVDSDARGPIEVWYSGGGEVFRLQNGRVVGVAGPFAEWRNVRMPELPAWSAMVHAVRGGAPLRWTRVRDVMPGYRADIRDSLSVRETLPPSRHTLQGVDAASLTWFEEVLEQTDGDDMALPLARYAVDFSGGRERVVYGEQCVALTLCLSWQQWPVAGRGGT